MVTGGQLLELLFQFSSRGTNNEVVSFCLMNFAEIMIYYCKQTKEDLF